MRLILSVLFSFIFFVAFAQKDSLTFYLKNAVQENKKGNYENALNNYLKVAFIQENNDKTDELPPTYDAIANLYQNRQIHQKALDYFLSAYQIRQKQSNSVVSPATILRNLQEIGMSYYLLNDLPKAAKYYQQALQQTEQQKENKARADILNKLFFIAQANKQYSQANIYASESLSLYESQKDTLAISNVLNNLGFLYREQNDIGKANEYFQKALTLNQKLAQSTQNDSKAVILQNIGVIYTNLNADKEATVAFESALEMRKKQGNPSKIAESYNYIAKHNLIEEYYEGAEKQALTAISIAQANQDYKNLIESYKILAEVYRKNGDYKKADNYVRLREAALDSLNTQKDKKNQGFQQTQIKAERQESEFRLLLSEKQKQELLLQQLNLEADKKEQELEINKQQLAALEKDKRLQQAEAQRQIAEKLRIQQDLEISKQKLLSEAQTQKVIALEKEQALQQLALEQQRRKTEAAELERTKSEASNKLAEQEREKERQLTNFVIYGGAGVFALVLVILALVIRNARQRRKDNEKLEAQAKIIKESNEELQSSEEELKQNLEELNATQEQLRMRYNELEQKNKNIASSIFYGKRIQEAMLPSSTEIQKLFPKSFVLFKPRDIVSGDFYWSAKRGDKQILVAADCTGHGIPGAFMSLLGLSTIYQLVFAYGITSPDMLLYELNTAIQKSLKQKENQTQEGMDIAVCVIDTKNRTLDYAGAHRPLYYIQEKQVFEQKANKFAVGGGDDERIFNKHTIDVSVPTAVYLFSDGYADQFGGDSKKKLGTKYFKEMLFEIHKQPVAIQKEILNERFEIWRGEEKQIDDVMVIGVMLNLNS